MFRLSCRFAIIQSKVYTHLYSVRASKQSDGELLSTIGDLDRELEEWKEAIPPEFRPDSDITSLPSPLIIHVVVLHFAYYNCLTTIHRMSIHRGFWTSRLSDYAIQGRNVRPLNPRVFNSANVCVGAARESINLIKYIPPGDYACVWLILYYPVSSLVTLFAHILRTPQDPLAQSDLRLMDIVVNFLSRICLDEQTGSIKRMYLVCNEFQRIAKMTLVKAEKEMSTRQKRKQEKEREKLERHSVSARQSVDLKRPAESMLGTPVLGSNAANGLVSAAQGFEAEQFNQAQGQGPAAFSSDFRQEWGNPSANGMMNGWMPSFEQDGNDAGGSMPSFTFGQQQNMMAPDAFGMGAFPQPYVPQDLWSMPMTFEWDWADMANFPNNLGGGGGGGFGG